MSKAGTLEHATEQRDAARAYRGAGTQAMGAMIGECDWEAEMAILQQEKIEQYRAFLESKAVIAIERGMEPGELNPNLKPHARDIAAWAIRGGARAIFASFGLHKTSIQLQICDAILKQREGCSLIICPLGVRAEFRREAKERGFGWSPVYIRTAEEFHAEVDKGTRHFLTNYERVRDGDLDPNLFTVVSLDEASCLRSYGSKTFQTFLTLFDRVPFKFVATATPDPNRTKELIHYAAFLGIMDSGQALTRFFKRDSSTSGNLQLHPHKEREFWLWVSTWAVFIERPSDMGYSDAGYILPELKIVKHRLNVDHSSAGFDGWGQGKLLRDAALGLRDAAREKRDSLQDRVECAAEIIADGPAHRHWIVWHDLEDERYAIEKTIVDCATVYGNQDLEEREETIRKFCDGEIELLATKPSIAGSGTNMQRHCRHAIFMGIGWKFNDFIQAIHRIYRFGQTGEVEIHLIYTESEDNVFSVLMEKWERHKERLATMTAIVKGYGLSTVKHGDEMRRSIGLPRHEVKGKLFTAVNNDNVLETRTMSDNSVDLIVTSWPFSDHYEYTESFNDFGHNDGDTGFFEQMEYLTPEILRILKPGRMYCVHAKDRLVYGSVSGLGMYSVNPFSDKCVAHLIKHGFIFTGRITIDTDVVRENAQTYRLGWSENAKDGTKMGVGSPEYVLLFRKLPTDLANAYADEPVRKEKPQSVTEEGEIVPFDRSLKMLPGTGYSRSRWQFDASSFWRSNGDRFLTPDEINGLSLQDLGRMWRQYNACHVYNHEQHVSIAEQLEASGILPASFMLLNPVAHSENAWTDIVRMRTLNSEQVRKDLREHVCPLQIDIVERLIRRFSQPGELVLDPFGGIGTVANQAVLMDRRGYSIELNDEYHRDAVGYMTASELKVSSPTLFDLLESEATVAC